MPTGVAPEATRGVSDSAAALVASSINGGGCLPPPTPAEKIAETLGKHMERAVNPEPTNYRAALPDSLSWRTTTQTMMVGGLAGEVTEEELAKVPLDLTSQGIILKKGRRERLNEQRRYGDLLKWETASMSANVTVFGEERAYR